jgi:hypothetical protein
MNILIKRLANSWLSLTMWFNTVLATVWLVLPEILTTLPVLREYIDGNIYKTLMLVAVIGNMVLRVKTTQDLADKSK